MAAVPLLVAADNAERESPSLRNRVRLSNPCVGVCIELSVPVTELNPGFWAVIVPLWDACRRACPEIQAVGFLTY